MNKFACQFNLFPKYLHSFELVLFILQEEEEQSIVAEDEKVEQVPLEGYK